MMVEAGAKEVSEEDMVQALEHAHAAIEEIIAGIEALAGRPRQEEDRGGGKAIGEEFRREVEGKVYGPLPTRCGSRKSSRTTVPLTPCWRTCWPAFLKRRPSGAPRRSRSLRSSRRRSCGTKRSSAGVGSTAASSTRSGRLRSKSASSPAPMARPCSRAAKRRRSSPRRSAPPTTSRRSRWWTANRGSASCSTTTSRRSRSAKCSSCAALAAAKSATARSPSARSRR